MLPRDFCLSHAELCELKADETEDLAEQAEWRLMAEEWRVAAALAGPPPASSQH